MSKTTLKARPQPVPVRLGGKLRRDVLREARRTGSSVSELIREGLRRRLYNRRAA